MSYKIERSVSGEGLVVLRVSGRIHAEHVDALRELVGREKGQVREEGQMAIDLKEVILVDREVVGFLASSEAGGIELRNCPAYIREWVARERTRTGEEPSDRNTGGKDGIENL